MALRASGLRRTSASSGHSPVTSTPSNAAAAGEAAARVDDRDAVAGELPHLRQRLGDVDGADQDQPRRRVEDMDEDLPGRRVQRDVPVGLERLAGGRHHVDVEAQLALVVSLAKISSCWPERRLVASATGCPAARAAISVIEDRPLHSRRST